MQISSAFKTIFAAGIALLIISCSSNSKKKEKDQEVTLQDKKKIKVQDITLQDIKQEEKNVEPPPPPPPKNPLPPIMEIKGGKTKCFVSEGLKYQTTVTLISNDNEAMGIVSSEELESGKKRSAAFSGIRNGNEFIVSFKRGDPPVIGDASEWINKPWTLKKEGAKEILHIIFHAKNYDTNKWEDSDYEFVPVDCK